MTNKTTDAPRTAHPPSHQAAARPALCAELLEELNHAHRLLVLMHDELPTDGRSRFAFRAAREGLAAEGATRHVQRHQLINRARAVLS